MARSGDGESGGTLTVIAANRLDTGAMVWLGRDDAWVPRVADAVAFAGPEAEAAQARAKLAERANRVIDPTPVEVTLEAGRPAPVRPRERIRAQGPSVRPDLGYQAEQVR